VRWLVRPFDSAAWLILNNTLTLATQRHDPLSERRQARAFQ